MTKIVVLAMVAAWAAVLIPPLLRSRVDNRPNSSVHDFRRHLATLQRTVPTQRVAPMRAMARPLAHSGHARSTASVTRAHDGSLGAAVAGTRQPGAAGTNKPGTRSHTGTNRRAAAAPARQQPGSVERRPAARLSQREIVRRRRTNVLMLLVATTAVTLFLAASTKSDAMVVAFGVSLVALGVFCYKLVQLRATNAADDDRYPYRAA